MRDRKIIILSPIVLIGFLLFLLYYLKSQSQIKVEKVLYFYTSLPYKVALEIVKNFEREHPRVKIIIKRAPSTYLRKEIIQKFLKGEVLADVGLFADPLNAIYLKKKDLLLRYSLRGNETKYYYTDKDGYFVSARILIPVIAYSSSYKGKIINNYENFGKVKNLKIGIVNPHFSGFALGLYYFAFGKFGSRFIKNVVKNNKIVIYKNNYKLAQAIKKGEVDIGILIDYYAKALNLKYTYPDENILIPSPIFIFKTTSNPKVSFEFVKYVLSPKGQKIFWENYMQPALRIYPLPEGDYVPINWNQVYKHMNNILRSFDSIFLNTSLKSS